VANPSPKGERKNQVQDARSAEGDEGDGKKNSGKREECIHQDDIDEAVDASAVVASDGADHKSERKRGENNATAHQHRDPRAVDDAREDVAPELVTSEPVRRGRRFQTRGKTDSGGI